MFARAFTSLFCCLVSELHFAGSMRAERQSSSADNGGDVGIAKPGFADMAGAMAGMMGGTMEGIGAPNLEEIVSEHKLRTDEASPSVMPDSTANFKANILHSVMGVSYEGTIWYDWRGQRVRIESPQFMGGKMVKIVRLDLLKEVTIHAGKVECQQLEDASMYDLTIPKEAKFKGYQLIKDVDCALYKLELDIPLVPHIQTWVSKKALQSSAKSALPVFTEIDTLSKMHLFNHDVDKPMSDELFDIKEYCKVGSEEVDNEVVESEAVDNEVVDNEVVDSEVIDNEVVDSMVADEKVVDNKVTDTKVIYNRVFGEVVDDGTVVFAIDKSFSMQSRVMGQDKNWIQKNIICMDELAEVLGSLSASTRFNIVWISGEAKKCFEDAVNATSDNIKRAVELTRQNWAYGSRDTFGGLKLAMHMKTAPDRIYFVSSGLTPQNPDSILSSIKTTVPVHVTAFFVEGDARVVKKDIKFMTDLAKLTHGTFREVTK